jgi:Tol biopolymer transport system component/DNA-binding winged helix-turn-helix (wHTH) protein
MAVRFGVFEVDLASGELRKQGLRIRLQEQPFAVLAALLEHPGEVVTREELIARLWPDGTIVDFDRGLNAAVTRLRQALSDSAETPRYVETVARRGYRFVGMVDAPAAAAVPPVVSPPEKHRRSPWPAAAAISALVMAGAGYWLMAGRSNPADASWTVAPLTTEPGYEHHASFSPDGTQVTFQWRQDERPHVFVKLVGPGDPIRLTSATEAEYGPVWSPDGRQIAFLRDLDKQTAGIYVIPALGGVERKVAETPAAPFWALGNPLRRLDWTRDGRHLVVSCPERAGAMERLLLVSLENGDKRWLTTGSSDPEVGDREPAVSPDGRTVAFVRGALTSSESIYLLPLRPDLTPASEPSLLTAGRNPAWTPDGRQLVYRPLRVYVAGLAQVDIAGGKPRALPAFGEDSFLPTVSRTGRLVFSRGTVDINVWRQELVAAGAPPAPVPLVSSTARDAEARYSPDGSRIAFQSNRSGHAEIWTCASDGARCTQLTAFNGAFITGTPRWSPDGRTIAFDSAAEGRFNVYTIDAGGGPVRRLTTGIIPSWSHDGKWIYYSGGNEIWKVPSQGGASVQVTRNGGLVAFESPDGTALYFTKTENNATLWKSGLDGNGETAVVQGVAHRGFAVTADSIYYLRVEPGGETIRRFRFATGEDTRITGLAKTAYLGLAFSPDGRYLLYSQIDQQGSDLMLVDGFR